jgi:hypothetical protein
VNVGLGDSLTGEFLECEVTDANGIVSSDRAQLRVEGREDRPESELEENAQKIKNRIDEIIGRLHERTPSIYPSAPVDPVQGVAIHDIETVVFGALEKGGLKVDRDKVRIR